MFKKLLTKQFRQAYYWMILLGLSNTLLNSMLLLFFSNTLTKNNKLFFRGYEWLVFLIILFATLFVNKIFQARITRLTYDMLFNFELKLIKELRYASLKNFEQFGTERIYTALNDARTMGNLPGVIINTFNAVIMILCCIIYFLFVYFQAAVVLIIVIFLLLIFHFKRSALIIRQLRNARTFQDDFYEIINDLLMGFKTIKMSSNKSGNLYHREVVPNRSQGKVLAVNAANNYLNNELTGRFSWFIIIGLIIYAFPALLPITSVQTTVFLVVILYLMGPINLIFSMIPYYGNIRVASERLNKFEEVFRPDDNQVLPGINKKTLPDFESLRFEGVCYEYYENKTDKGFSIGPIDLTIHKGEVLFITGGNGSGKTTFFNILTGLYYPTAGTIYYNNVALDANDYTSYRDHIAAIFTTQQLLSRNYEDVGLDDESESVNEWIDQLAMRDIIREGGKDLHKKLSKGQQKRLMFIYALLENKPLLALDEWAAEQDPVYREYFYSELLPFLSERGKTIIAITHDDKYFNQANRVIVFEFGKISRINSVNNSAMNDIR